MKERVVVVIYTTFFFPIKTNIHDYLYIIEKNIRKEAYAC